MSGALHLQEDQDAAPGSWLPSPSLSLDRHLVSEPADGRSLFSLSSSVSFFLSIKKFLKENKIWSVGGKCEK